MQITFISSRSISPKEILSEDVVFVMPFTETGMAKKTANLMAERANHPGQIICVHDSDHEGFVSIANKVFRSSNTRFFGYVAQDAFPGRQWLRLAMNAAQSKIAALLAFNDGKWSGELASFGLVESRWAQQNYNGDLFYPQYKQHYADTELTLLAQACNRYTYDPNSLLVEVDWEKDKKQINAKDQLCFRNRCKNKFDGQINNQTLLNKFS